MAGSIGMMNEAYFLSKATLLDWVNNFLQTKIEKVEHMASGACYSNLFDAIHPRTIPMQKVDFTCKYDYEYSKNWKLLQTAFLKVGIKKQIPVEKLIKARYQDNLEFLQWFYKYAHDCYPGDCDNPDYDAIGRRDKAKGGSQFGGSNNNNSKQNSRRSSQSQRARGKENLYGNPSHRPPSARNNKYNSMNSHSQSTMSRANTHNNNNNNNLNNNNNNNNNTIENGDSRRRELENLRFEHSKLLENNEATSNQLDLLKKDHSELRAVAKDIEKERDFYFSKVLKVEELCKNHKDQTMPLLNQIYKVLYEADESGESQAQSIGNEGSEATSNNNFNDGNSSNNLNNNMNSMNDTNNNENNSNIPFNMNNKQNNQSNNNDNDNDYEMNDNNGNNNGNNNNNFENFDNQAPPPQYA